jgi:hypothetical protein
MGSGGFDAAEFEFAPAPDLAAEIAAGGAGENEAAAFRGKLLPATVTVNRTGTCSISKSAPSAMVPRETTSKAKRSDSISTPASAPIRNTTGSPAGPLPGGVPRHQCERGFHDAEFVHPELESTRTGARREPGGEPAGYARDVRGYA